MSNINILPGNLTVTGNVSTATAGIGGNLVVGSNVYVTGNLYSANVTLSGGGGGGGGVTNLYVGSGLTSTGNTGTVTISAVVSSVSAGTGIQVSNTGGTFAVSTTGNFGSQSITNTSGTNNTIGGVSLSGGQIGATNIITSINTAGQTGLTSSNNNGIVSIAADVKSITAGTNISLTNNNGNYIINALSTSGGGIIDASAWATYPATQNVNMNSKNLSNTNDITCITDEYFLSSIPSSAAYISTLNISTNIPYYDVTLTTFQSNQTGVVRIAGDSNASSSFNVRWNGAIDNSSNTANSIGGVLLSNRVISNFNGFYDAGGYVAITTGDIRSRIGHLIMDSSGIGNELATLCPVANGTLRLTGNSLGRDAPNFCQIDAGGGISNASSSSNNIGNVVLSNGVISNVSGFYDGGGYVSIKTGDTRSRIGHLIIDNSYGGNDIAVLCPVANGTLRLTGDSLGINAPNFCQINAGGGISNASNTSNSIGGVVLSNGNIVASNSIKFFIGASNIDGNNYVSWVPTETGIYDIYWVDSNANWRYIKGLFTTIIPVGSNPIEILKAGDQNLFSVESISRGTITLPGYKFKAATTGVMTTMYISKISPNFPWT